MNPAHKPHEQLRTEAPVQKEHNDKYVSAFISGEPNVDMSFRNPVLSKSSDHFKVGIDELTVNLTGLSMLEVNDDVVFRIIRRGYVDNVAAGQPGEDQAGGNRWFSNAGRARRAGSKVEERLHVQSRPRI